MEKDKAQEVLKNIKTITTTIKQKDIKNKPEDFVGGLASIFEAVVDLMEMFNGD